MNLKNCPNCGATIDVDKSKCDYCGTSYFDLSALQLDGSPFFLKVKMKQYVNGKEYDAIVTAKCISKNALIEATNESTVISNDIYNIGTLITETSCSLSFDAEVVEHNGTKFTIELLESRGD